MSQSGYVTSFHVSMCKRKKSRSSPYIPSCGRGGARRMKDDGRDKRLDILTLIVAIIALVKACC